jgi:hypothetical protein
MKFDPHYRTAKPQQTGKSVDGLSTSRPVSRSATVSSAAVAVAQPVVPPRERRTYAKPAEKQGFWQKIQLPLILFGGTISGFMIQTMALGMLVIGIYGIYAIVTKVPSRTTFMLAALCVGAVTILLLLKPNAELAANFSTYTFLLLVIGVFTLLREGRPLKRRKRSRTRSRR